MQGALQAGASALPRGQRRAQDRPGNNRSSLTGGAQDCGSGNGNTDMSNHDVPVRIDLDTPKIDPNRRYRIAEVSRLLHVPVHVLRYWESLIPEIKPPRDRSNKRYYKADLIDKILKVRQYLRSEGLSPEGARTRLIQAIQGVVSPASRREAIDLLDKLTEEVRAAIDLLDRVRATDDT